MIPSRSKFLALCVAVALFNAAPSLAAALPPPAIIEAHADGAMLRITGLELAGGTPRITLGNSVLSVVAATATHIDALLPVDVAPGSYLLTLTLTRSRRDGGGSDYDEFWVTVGGAGSAGKDGKDGKDGATGPQGPAGLAGTTGAKGETGPKGDTGPKGETGPKGDNGAKGADGPAGAAGATGAAGPAGLGSTSGQSAVTALSTSPVSVAGSIALVLMSTTVTIPVAPPDSDLLVTFTGLAKSNNTTPCVWQYQLQLDSEPPENVAASGPIFNDLFAATSTSFMQAFNGLAPGNHTLTVLGRRGGCSSVSFLEGRLTTVILRK